MPRCVEHRFGATPRVSSPRCVDELPTPGQGVGRSQGRAGVAQKRSGALPSADVDGSGQGLPQTRHLKGAVALRPEVAAVVPVPGGQQDGGREAQSVPCPDQVTQAGLGEVPGVVLPNCCHDPFSDHDAAGAARRHWFLSVLIEDGRRRPEVHDRPESALGIDRGVNVAIATSSGALIDRALSSDGERQRTAALQRKLSRCARRSVNRGKIRAQLAAVRERERHRRQDFCAQNAHQVAEANAVVVLEDLKTRNMTRSAKGTLDNPGRNVKAKSGLNRAILAKGWYQFALALSSAARYTGTTVVKVPAAYTSQRCSACAHLDPKSRESQAVFRCTHCTHTEHADVNAAKNILAAGLAVAACEDQPRPAGQARSTKQEPAGNRKELLPQPVHTAPAA